MVDLQKILDRTPDYATVDGGDKSISILFGVKGFGWGEIRFWHDDAGKLHCANECMDKDKLKMILGKMVDLCELEDK